MNPMNAIRMALYDATSLPMHVVDFNVLPFLCACVHDSSGRVSEYCSGCACDVTWFTRTYFTGDFRDLGMWCDHCFAGQNVVCTNDRVWRLVRYPCCNQRKTIAEYFKRPGLECVSCAEMWEGVTFCDFACTCACPPGTHGDDLL
jgi:hypothetical protein